MRHTREEVIKRTIRAFEQLDDLVKNLSDQDWNRLLSRPETKDPWTVKDALAHITHWKADTVIKIKKQPIPLEEKGLNETDGNHLIYERWRERSPQEVFAWHKQVQEEVLDALRDAPEAWFSGRERVETAGCHRKVIKMIWQGFCYNLIKNRRPKCYGQKFVKHIQTNGSSSKRSKLTPQLTTNAC